MTDGIYPERRIVSLDSDPQAFAAALRRAAEQTPFREWVPAVLIPALNKAAESDNPEVVLDAQRAQALLTYLAGLLRSAGDKDAGMALVANAFELGSLVERLHVRPFEPKVRARRRSDKGLAKANSEKAARADALKAEAEAAIEWAKAEYPKQADRIDFIKKKAADKLKISKQALNLRLRKGDK